MGAVIHDQVLSNILKAPVNLFFDVTPIGMIINRIRSDMEVFRKDLFIVYSWITDMSTHWVYLLFCLAIMESFTVMVSVIILLYLITAVALPMNTVKKQMCKIEHAVKSPIESYFHEAMNGVTVIKAFGQNENVLKK